jgi:hypothetical protein
VRADVQRVGGVDHALLRRARESGSRVMAGLGRRVAVGVRIDVQHREIGELAMHRAQLRQRHRAISAHAERQRAAVEDRADHTLDLLERVLYFPGHDVDVAPVRHL